MTRQGKIPEAPPRQPQDIAAVAACLTTRTDYYEYASTITPPAPVSRSAMTPLGYALVMGRRQADLTAVAGSHPGWHLWLSDAGHVYATRRDRESYPYRPVTVDAPSAEMIGAAIEKEARRLAAAGSHAAWLADAA